jgi:hypothetical protein
MTTTIVVTPAPSRGGVVLRDAHTRSEIFVETDEILGLARKLQRERDELLEDRKRGA